MKKKQEMQYFIQYYLKIGISLKSMFTKSTGVILVIPTITISTQINPTKAIMLLFGLFILDFITGILASYLEWKRTKSTERLISSEKLRLSGAKVFTYLSTILVVYAIEKIFIDRTFQFQIISNKNFTITSVSIAFFCAIEFYSIVFENMKKCGIDIMAQFYKLISVFNKFKNKVNT